MSDEHDVMDPLPKRSKGKLRGFEWWESIGKPKFACAPMVDQSELAFRMLCKQYDCPLGYTPMFHGRLFATDAKYRKQHWQTCPEERPVIAQFCGDNAEVLRDAALFIHQDVDCVDLNLGCPQGIARKGHYGSFLLNETDLIVDIVKTWDVALSCPVSCKIRKVSKEPQDTMHLVYALEAAGVSMIGVHGRLKEEKGQLVREVDWDIIKLVKQRTSVPIIANGGIETQADALRCLEYTGADAVMSAEALLENPALFSGLDVKQDVLAGQYLDMVEKYPYSDRKAVKKHLFTFLYAGLQVHTDLRAQLGSARDIPAMREVAAELRRRREANPLHQDKGWYRRYRNPLGDRSGKEAKVAARLEAVENVAPPKEE